MSDISQNFKKMSQVNLDALIKREDLFKVSDDLHIGDKNQFPLLRLNADLMPDAYTLKTLRKPDFQRETSEWKPERIFGIVNSFINGDIIPAVILWHWKGINFIIDGGHRISAIVAWITDDYGDGVISDNYFIAANISKDQRALGERTRNLFKNSKVVHPFKTYDYAFQNPDKVSHEEFQKASQILVSKSLQVQWIEAKTSKEAEKSFFRINGEASPINETEALILKSREKPNAISARAIIHSGSAHKYWRKFGDKQPEIEKIASKIHGLLFHPELDEKRVVFPIAGKGYSDHSLDLVFGIVNMINGLKELNSKRKTFLKKESDEILPEKDDTGEATLIYLNKVERIISIIAGENDGISLGLSPLIYFYNPKGRFQITSFLAIVHIMLQWDTERKSHNGIQFQKFSSVREQFEDFLLEYKYFTTEATMNIGSGIKSYEQLAELYMFVIESLVAKLTSKEILEKIETDERFYFIKKVKSDNIFEDQRSKPGRKITKETAHAAAIRLYLTNKVKCPICKGHATFKSYNWDHDQELRNGGKSNIENLQLTHPYCNEEKDKILELKNNKGN